LQKSDGKPQKNSGQKAIVVYDEFKYYTQAKNYKNVVEIIKTSSQKQDTSGNLICELQPSEAQMFELASPNSMQVSEINESNKKHGNLVFNSSIKKALNQSKGTDSKGTEQSKDPAQIDDTWVGQVDRSQLDTAYEAKILKLQEKVEVLEKELRASQDKNQEIQKNVKKSSILDIQKDKGKHLSDTEDSLILSEKKKTRASL